MGWFTISPISAWLAYWVSRRQGRRPLLWSGLAFLFPFVSLLLSQTRASETRPVWKTVLGVIVCILIPLLALLIIDGLRESQQFCAMMAPIYSFILTCLGNTVIANGHFLEHLADGAIVAVQRPLSLTVMCVSVLALTAAALFMVSLRTRLVYFLSGLVIGVVGDLFRNPLRYMHYLNGNTEQLEPWYLSRTIVFSVQMTLIYCIAVWLAVRFVKRQGDVPGPMEIVEPAIDSGPG